MTALSNSCRTGPAVGIRRDRTRPRLSWIGTSSLAWTEQCANPVGDIRGAEPEPFEIDLAGGRCPVAIEPNGPRRRHGASVPTRGHAGFDGHRVRISGGAPRRDTLRSARRTPPSTGIETTRVGMPSPASIRCARARRAPRRRWPARWPLEPLSRIGNDIRASVQVARQLRIDHGNFWRLSTSATGRCFWPIANRHASAVSLASAGRTTASPGMTRNDIRCSTGW